MTTKKKPQLFGKSGAKKSTKKLDQFVTGKESEDGTRVMIYMDRDLHMQYRVWCAERRRSFSSMVRDALVEYTKAQG